LLQQAKGIYLADFAGLNVEKTNELRSSFRKEQVIYRVIKNTLIRLACEEVGYKDLIQHLEGPTAVAMSMNDPVSPVRVISEFGKKLEKDQKKPTIKAGILEEAYVGTDQIAKLKDIPPREVLLTQIVTVMQSPIADFVGVLNEIVRSFVAVLQAVIDKKQAEGQS